MKRNKNNPKIYKEQGTKEDSLRKEVTKMLEVALALIALLALDIFVASAGHSRGK